MKLQPIGSFVAACAVGRLARRLFAPLAAIIALVALCGCASTPPPRLSAEQLADDALFQPLPRPVDASTLFDLSPEMQRYAEAQLLGKGQHDRRLVLLDALRTPSGLQLRYDASVTRDAASTFAARQGNCLSLTVMTAAFARHLGLPVRFHQVLMDDEYTRNAGMFFVSGHINISIGTARHHRFSSEPDNYLVDFLPPSELRGQRSVHLEESTVRAMYLNNRAAEHLAAGRLNDAYWWARAAIREDPQFLAGANTLAVVYLQSGRPLHAERALRFVIEREPAHVSAWANLVRALGASGRRDEAEQAAMRLAQLQPRPPFWHFDRGREAMARHDYAQARREFESELRLQPHQHEAHFWLAQALVALGDTAAAQRHLASAAESSPTLAQHALYGAKLERLKELTRTH